MRLIESEDSQNQGEIPHDPHDPQDHERSSPDSPPSGQVILTLNQASHLDTARRHRNALNSPQRRFDRRWNVRNLQTTATVTVFLIIVLIVVEIAMPCSRNSSDEGCTGFRYDLLGLLFVLQVSYCLSRRCLPLRTVVSDVNDRWGELYHSFMSRRENPEARHLLDDNSDARQDNDSNAQGNNTVSYGST